MDSGSRSLRGAEHLVLFARLLKRARLESWRVQDGNGIATATPDADRRPTTSQRRRIAFFRITDDQRQQIAQCLRDIDEARLALEQQMNADNREAPRGQIRVERGWLLPSV